MIKYPCRLVPSQQYFYKEAIFYIKLWSTVQCNFLSHREVTNNSDKWLDAQKSPSSVRYHAPSKSKVHQRSRKIICGGNSGSYESFLQKIIILRNNGLQNILIQIVFFV